MKLHLPVVVASFVLSNLLPLVVLAASPTKMETVKNWQQLRESDRFTKVDGVHYYEFKTANGSDAHLVVAETAKKTWQLRPEVSPKTSTTTALLKKTDAVASVNGAFFNLTNGESTSFIMRSGEEICDPTTNKALTDNPKLKPFLKVIFNRSELRILKPKNGDLQYKIVPHNAPIANDASLLHSIQAGPQLLPTITAKEEAFLRAEADGKIADSIGVNRPAARTAFGVTKNGAQVMLLCVAGQRQNEFSSGLTLAQLAELLKDLGCVEALNLDGGTSTTMSIRASDDSVQMICGRSPETYVKSVLSIFKP